MIENKKDKKQDVRQIVRELDLFSRIYIGQYDNLFDAVGFRICHLSSWNSDQDPVGFHEALALRQILIPELGDWGFTTNLGIWSEDTPEVAKRAYDLQQAIRYQADIACKVSWPRVPYFHCEWAWDQVPTRQEWIKHAHTVLKSQGVPGYEPDRPAIRPWLCPILVENIKCHDFNVKGCIVTADAEVDEILDAAKLAYLYIQSGDAVHLFELLYPDRAEELRPATERLEEILKTNMSKPIC